MSIPGKILIADDSPVVAKMLSLVLGRAGYEIVTAADGIEATQAVYREQPDLIVLDIFMPRMNGYQVCRLLKHDPAVAGIPVVINTASDSRSAEFWSRHTGADDFFIKGTAPAELLATVERLLAARAAPVDTLACIEPSPEEILSRVSTLADQALYDTTVEQLKSQTILQNLREGILTLGGEGQIAGANTFMCRMVGREEADLAGLAPTAVLGEDTGAIVLKMFEAVLRGEDPAPEDAEVAGADDEITPVAINAAPLHDYLGEIVGCVFLFQDITRRKQVESLNQLKNDLTDMIVHDLRTPLTALLSGLQTVEMLGDMNEDQREFMNMSIEGGQILLGMINDLLDISKMENGSLQLEKGDVTPRELVGRALRQVEALAKAKDLTLSAQVPPGLPPVVGDADKLLRTLVNLLGNAIKFTPHGGSISISTQFVPRPGRTDATVFGVHDTGEGIPHEAFERIFAKFGQVETRQGGRKMSTGLGLTFCKMVVQAHGGRIWVQSEMGQGSEFYFALPLQDVPESGAETS